MAAGSMGAPPGTVRFLLTSTKACQGMKTGVQSLPGSVSKVAWYVSSGFSVVV
jgi:hypothetical protein